MLMLMLLTKSVDFMFISEVFMQMLMVHLSFSLDCFPLWDLASDLHFGVEFLFIVLTKVCFNWNKIIYM